MTLVKKGAEVYHDFNMVRVFNDNLLFYTVHGLKEWKSAICLVAEVVHVNPTFAVCWNAQ